MTRKTNARLAGFMFLFYIATGITGLALSNQVASGNGTAAQLAAMAQHATTVRLSVLLTMCGFVSAVVLGVTLYALTREEDRDLAMIALCCRVTEGVNAVAGAGGTLQLLAIAAMATGSTAVAASDAAAAQAYGGLMLNQGGWTGNIGALCFVMASTLYSYLFLRARTIPVVLAWLGLLASVLLLAALPLGLVGVVNVSFFMWMPMLVFEVAFALWLIIKGVKPPNRQLSTADA
ncbi:MAG TPA: DUF4386 domain-containing protein [Pyrinomonadaceae bacterium]|nr:DUF4386 domain-containing protein [Pyrinomonadaceae bacterium]